MKNRLSEVSLGPPVKAYLADLEWEIYQEVTGPGGSVADIVGTKDHLLLVVEMKTGLGFDVLAQAMHWKRYAHWSWVAVPPAKGDGRRFAIQVCKDYGIGVLEVCGDRATVVCPPALNRTARVQDIRKTLREEHKTYAVAGNNISKRWSPFKATCKALREILVSMGGSAPVGEAIKRIKHHYSADNAARASLVKWAESRKIPGVAVDRTGKRLRFRLEDEKQ